MNIRCLVKVVILVALLPFAVHAEDEWAGSLEAVLEGKKVRLAALESNYQINLAGDLVEVEVSQTFLNPYDKPINAKYLFPLNTQAAVHAMVMTVGDEVIEAQIDEIRQAQNTFKEAKQAGKSAVLLEQHRPNMFTQSVANLMPALPITVVIKYTHAVKKVDGAYELVVPLVVGPRFNPAGSGVAPDHSDVQSATPGVWQLEQLPAYPPTAGVHLPTDISERVSMVLNLETPLPLSSVSSDTHALSVRDISSTQVEVSFAAGKVLDNRDFVLRYAMAGSQPDAGLLSHWEPAEGGYFSLLIEPPGQNSSTAILPREMVFLLDCSGSMSGAPMAASKLFMTHALKALRPTDTFRIIRFSDSATEFSRQPLEATPANIAAGLKYTKSLYGSGGTMMTSGIQQALGIPAPQGVVRNVVFLTDGYIGNEISILSMIERLRGEARLFAFGVGAGVNRYLMGELGRVGRGFTRYFDPTRDQESMDTVVAGLVARLQSPLLTDLHIDWGQLQVVDVKPAVLPDLYAGDAIRVSGRFATPAQGDITISGRNPSQTARLVRQVTLSDVADRPVVRQLWARQAVADLMHEFVTPLSLREDAVTNSQLQAAVTALGLNFDLVTRWTAFVAVSRKVYNTQPNDTVDADVALPKVAGVSKLAYNTPAMAGFGAPEPGVLLGLLVALLTLTGLNKFKVGKRVSRCH
jgi:Ca-activated chloride channel homolog